VLIVHPHGLVESIVPQTIEAMAADRIRALRSIRPRGPYIIGGHCNGALVAFEMARLLLEAGEQVPAVVVIEARAPGDGADEPVGERQAWVTLDASGALRVITPRDRQWDLWLRYLQAMDRYAGQALAGHLAIVRSRGLRDARYDLGWSRFAASTEVHVLPGNHVTLVTRHVAELAEVIRKSIDRALAVCSRSGSSHSVHMDAAWSVHRHLHR
jgi:thioesterase domain-containing protein